MTTETTSTTAASSTATPTENDVGKVLMAGTLYKQSSFGMYTAKWCSLHAAHVVLYDDPEDKKPQLVMPLVDVRVVPDESNTKVFVIHFQGMHHKYKCSSSEQCAKWVKAFEVILRRLARGTGSGSPPITPSKERLPHSTNVHLFRNASPSPTPHSPSGTTGLDSDREGSLRETTLLDDNTSPSPAPTDTGTVEDETVAKHSHRRHLFGDKRRNSNASDDGTGMTPPGVSILSASVPATSPSFLTSVNLNPLKRKTSVHTSPSNSPIPDSILGDSRISFDNLGSASSCAVPGRSSSVSETGTSPRFAKGTPPMLSLAPQPAETTGIPPVAFLSDPADKPEYFTQWVEYHTAFEEPDSEANVMWLPQPDGRYSIRGGNVYKLVQYLTHPSENDLDFMQAFLISYHVFLTGPKLLDILAARFYMRRPVSMDFATFSSIRLRVRLRIVSTLKYWTKLYIEGAFYDEEMVTKMIELLNTLSVSCSAAGNVLKSIEMHRNLKLSGEARQREEVPPPLLLTAPSTAPVSLLDLHPEELARQIMLMEWETFSHIHPKEFIKQAWNKPALKEKEAPNITRMIEETNKRTMWVLTEILHGESAPVRALIIHRFILATEASHQMRNYNAAMEISCALQDSAVHRLKATWKLVPAPTMELFEKHCNLFATTNNFTAYRDILKCAVAPCVPYLGVALKDITFASDGNPSLIPNTELINFVKYRNCSKIIATLGQFQLDRPPFTPISEVQSWIHKQQSTALVNTDAAYDQSLITESQQHPKDCDTGTAAEKVAKSLFKSDGKAISKATPKKKHH